MTTLTILRGLPGSGKTTRARELVADDPRCARVNRDDLRMMMFGAKVNLTPDQERAVTLAEHAMARALLPNWNVVTDDMNLRPRYVRDWLSIAAQRGADVVMVEMPTPLDECIDRDAQRDAPVSADVIRRIAAKFLPGGRFLPKAPVEGENSQRPSEPVLPRRIKPEDVRVGMVVERRRGEVAFRDRVRSADVRIDGTVANLWKPVHATVGWSIWLIEDAPAPVDPDAELVERMAKEVHDRNCADVGCRDWDGHGESTRKAWWEDARVVIRNLRAQGFDVTARAEQ